MTAQIYKYTPAQKHSLEPHCSFCGIGKAAAKEANITLISGLEGRGICKTCVVMISQLIDDSIDEQPRSA